MRKKTQKTYFFSLFLYINVIQRIIQNASWDPVKMDMTVVPKLQFIFCMSQLSDTPFACLEIKLGVFN